MVGIALGLSIVDAIAAVTGLDATLKWPNDVLIDGPNARILARSPATR